MKSPCKPDCPDRSQDCHGTCEAYQKYWQEKLKSYEQRAKIKEQNSPRRGYVKYMHMQTLHKKGGHS